MLRAASVACAIALGCAPSRARAYECTPDPSYTPRRDVIQSFSPTLLVGWTFDRSPSGFIGFEVSYVRQYRGTFGGYAHALLLSDPDAASQRPQLGFGGIGAPWSSPVHTECWEPSLVDPRPLGRVGYALRASNMVADATSFAQASVSASAIVGVLVSFALPLSGGKSHGMQPSFALSLSYPFGR